MTIRNPKSAIRNRKGLTAIFGHGGRDGDYGMTGFRSRLLPLPRRSPYLPDICLVLGDEGGYGLRTTLFHEPRRAGTLSSTTLRQLLAHLPRIQFFFPLCVIGSDRLDYISSRAFCAGFPLLRGNIARLLDCSALLNEGVLVLHNPLWKGR